MCLIHQSHRDQRIGSPRNHAVQNRLRRSSDSPARSGRWIVRPTRRGLVFLWAVGRTSRLPLILHSSRGVVRGLRSWLESPSRERIGGGGAACRASASSLPAAYLPNPRRQPTESIGQEHDRDSSDENEGSSRVLRGNRPRVGAAKSTEQTKQTAINEKDSKVVQDSHSVELHQNGKAGETLPRSTSK